MKPITLLTLCLLLTACAHDQKLPTKETPPPESKSEAMSLQEMDPGFLYLAAQNAINEGNADLAIRLLQALVEKDPDAVEPSLELSELLIGRQRPDLAQGVLQHLAERSDLTDDQRQRLQLLQAHMYASMHQFEDALSALRPYLAANPDDVDARRMQAQMLVNLGRTDEAVAAIKAAVRSHDSPELRLLQAQLYVQTDKPKAAIAALKRMQQLAQDDDRPALMMSQIHVQHNQPAKAESVLRDFLAAHPEALRVSNALGQMLVRQGRFKEAIEIYREMATRTGNNAEVVKALGLLYYQIHDFAHAEATFAQLLAQQKDTEVRFYHAATLEAMGKDKQASKEYGMIDTTSPQYTQAQIRLAGIDAKNGDFEQAAKRLLAVIDDQPRDTDAYVMLSGVRLEQKQYRKLIDETAPALTLPSVPLGLLFNRAIAFDYLKQYDEAESTLRRILAKDPRHAESLNFLGYSLADRGIRLDEAEQLIRRALALKPDDGYYLDSLAWVYFKRGNYAEAARIQRQALEQVKDDPVMLEHMGDILWKQGKQAEARDAWRQALQQGHEDPALINKKIQLGL